MFGCILSCVFIQFKEIEKKHFSETDETDQQIETLQQLTPIPDNGLIPYGYYRVNDTYMDNIPYGYTTASDKQTLIPTTLKNIYIDSSTVLRSDTLRDDNLYNTNVNNQYRPTENNTDIPNQQKDPLNPKNNYTMVRDKNGKLLYLPPAKQKGSRLNTQDKLIYYESGDFKYGPRLFVPNYEQSIYLSQKTPIASSSGSIASSNNDFFSGYNVGSVFISVPSSYGGSNNGSYVGSGVGSNTIT